MRRRSAVGQRVDVVVHHEVVSGFACQPGAPEPEGVYRFEGLFEKKTAVGLSNGGIGHGRGTRYKTSGPLVEIADALKVGGRRSGIG